MDLKPEQGYLPSNLFQVFMSNIIVVLTDQHMFINKLLVPINETCGRMEKNLLENLDAIPEFVVD